MDKVKKIYVEEGMIVVKENINDKEVVTKCHGLDIKGPSEMKSDEDGNIWVETESNVEKIVRINPENIRKTNAN
jgi:sugar lactone lactonase YvrE|tara:strand:- start:34 stop:255 length:222 start_codon:yes stop_codon:yes gene_type:complete